MNTAVEERRAAVTTESLWREFSAPLRRFLRKRARNDGDADDLLQTVFLRLHQRIDSLHDTSKLQGWVYRIAQNAVVDYYRTRKDAVEFDDTLGGESVDGLREVDLTPALRRFIASLPSEYREALVRHEFQAQPIKEVASQLGISETAAKSRIRRARLMLREMLDRCCRFEFDRRGRVIDAEPRVSPRRPAAKCRC